MGLAARQQAVVRLLLLSPYPLCTSLSSCHPVLSIPQVHTLTLSDIIRPTLPYFYLATYFKLSINFSLFLLFFPQFAPLPILLLGAIMAPC